jgi:hypothetical protein
MSAAETTVAPSSTMPAPAKPCRRWYQFTLRTLTIFMVLSSVLLGALGWRLQRARKQARAVATLTSMGAEVGYDYWMQFNNDGAIEYKKGPQQSPIPGFLRRILGDDFFHDVYFVHRPKTSSQAELDSAWNAIGELPHLKVLEISGKDGDHGPGIANLRKTSELQMLLIRNGTATSDDLAVLSALRELRGLHCLGPECDDSLLQGLCELPHLRELSIRAPQITEDGVNAIARHKNLEVLKLLPGPIGNRELELLSKLSQLRYLSIEDGLFDDHGAKSLARLENLELLEIENSQIGNDGLRALTPLTKLTRLGLNRTRIDDEGLPRLEEFLNLGQLWLDGTLITDAGLVKTKLPTTLGHLTFRDTRISDIGLQTLTKLKSLRLVDARGTGVTKNGVTEFNKVLPTCTVAHSPPLSQTLSPKPQ